MMTNILIFVVRVNGREKPCWAPNRYSMRALVISGGGSKGAFAGGVAQYLVEVKRREYDILLENINGTSTGSLLIPHIALNNLGKLYKHIYQYKSTCHF